MDNAFIRFVISICEECFPARRQILSIHSKTMILRCHETPVSSMVGNRLVVSSVAIPRKTVCVMSNLTAN